jgi:hypothetical protein
VSNVGMNDLAVRQNSGSSEAPDGHLHQPLRLAPDLGIPGDVAVVKLQVPDVRDANLG